MNRPDPILAYIAREHLSIPTLASRKADSLDFHNVAVWQVEAALKAAFDAGSRSATNYSKSHDATRIDREGSMTARHSPAPWSYEYSPYRFHRGEDGIESELPAFEVFDADCNKVFDTNEDSPCELQEANACMASTAPRLLTALVVCADLLADYDDAEGEEGDAYRNAKAAIAEATGRAA
jgi:hypothetical protein